MFYSNTKSLTKCIILSLILFCSSVKLRAQTTLATGEMAVFGIDLTNNKLGFVTLKALSPGTVLYLSDFGWDNSAGKFHASSTGNAGEFLLKWTIQTSVPAGTMFYLKFSTSGTPATYTLTNLTNSTDIASAEVSTLKAVTAADPFVATGDNFFIYQDAGNDAANNNYPILTPKFICGFNDCISNSGTNIDATGWSNPFSNGFGISSSIPTSSGTQGALINGTNAIGMTGSYRSANVWYVGPTSQGDVSIWTSRINNTSNWSGANASVVTTLSSPISMVGLSADATLSNLTLSDGILNPTFASGTTSYTASVPNTTSSVSVTPTQTNANASIKVNGSVVTSGSASGAIPLNVGSNTITTVITAQDGTTTQTYSITVTRSAALSTDATLSNLTISNGILSPVFAGGTTNYTASVCALSSIAITPTVNEAHATVTVNGATVASGSPTTVTLSAGSNTITTVVTAQDGTTTQTYTTTVTVNALPAAGITGTSAICTGGTTTLTAGGGASYLWDDAGATTTAALTVSPAATKTYTVTVTSAAGCTATTSQTVTVNSVPVIAYTVSDSVVCQGNSVTLDVNLEVVDQMTTGANNSLPIGYNPSQSFTPAGTGVLSGIGIGIVTVPGNGIVTLKIYKGLNSASGMLLYTNTYTVAQGANKLPVSGITLTGGQEYSFLITDNGSGAIGYDYTSYAGSLYVFGGNPVSGQSLIFQTYTPDNTSTITWNNGITDGQAFVPAATTTYTVTVTNTSGCTATKSQKITVNPPLVADVTGTLTICKGDTTTLTASGGTSYLWDDANATTTAGLTVSPAVTTTYTVKVTGAGGCTATISKTITVNQLPTAAITGTTKICSGGTTTLTASGGTSYLWDDAGATNTAGLTVSPASTTAYTVKVTAATGCSATASTTVTISTPALTIAGSSYICPEEYIALEVKDGSNASRPYTYSWSDGSTDSTNTPVTNSPGVYTYTVTVTNGYGCTATASQTITYGAVLVRSTAGSGASGICYTTLKESFDAINNGVHKGDITITVEDITTETATCLLNASGIGAASYNHINLKPDGARTIKGNFAGQPLIDISGADSLYIDGINSGGKALVFINQSTSSTANTSTIRYRDGVTQNKLLNCNITGASKVPVNIAGGTVAIIAGTGVSNDGITISGSTIGNITSTSIHTKGIYIGAGGTGTNSHISINNSEIFNFYNAAASSVGIEILPGSSSISIVNNKFYQEFQRNIPTGLYQHAISINCPAGNSFTLSQNVIGYKNNTKTGSYSLILNGTAQFRPIFINADTTSTTTLNNNEIGSIDITGSSSGTGNQTPFIGIHLAQGKFSLSENTVGHAAPGRISYTSSSTNTSGVIAIGNFSAGAFTSNSSSIGGIVLTDVTAPRFFNGILSSTTSPSWNCADNSIGNIDSVKLSSTNAASYLHAIESTGSKTAGKFYNNSVYNVKVSGGTGTDANASLIGIATIVNDAAQEFYRNSITNNSNTGSSAGDVIGIYTNGGKAIQLDQNFINNLAGYNVYGIYNNGSATSHLLTNNSIVLGRAAYNQNIYGFYNTATAGTSSNFYNNTINIVDTAKAGNKNSYAVYDNTSSARSYINNIFVNTRINQASATGKNTIVSINDLTGLSINHNLYYGKPSTIFANVANADIADFSAWKAAITQDTASYNSNPQFQGPYDVHINPTVFSDVEGNGIEKGVINDFDDGNPRNPRSQTSPVDIGADGYVSCVIKPAITGPNVICKGDQTTIKVKSAIGYTYSWTENNALSTFLTAKNLASVNIKPTQTSTYTIVIGITGCANIYTLHDTVTVNPIPVADTLQNVVVCKGAEIDSILLAGKVVGSRYKWTNNKPGIGLAASGTDTIPAFTAANTITGPIVATITVTPEYTNKGVTCYGTPNLFTITVNPIPNVNPSADQTVCFGSQIDTIPLTGTIPGTLYSWYNDDNSIGLNVIGTGSIRPFVPVRTTVSNIEVTPSFTYAGLTCTGKKDTLILTVNPVPTVNTVANQVICNGSDVSDIAFTGSATSTQYEAATVYNWTNDKPGIGLAATGTGDIDGFTAVNNTGAPIVATITVTPAYTAAGKTCTGNTKTFTIIVNPKPVINTVPDVTVCNNSIVAATTFGSNVASVTYKWHINSFVGLITTSGNTSVPSFTASTASGSPVTATVAATANYTNAGLTCISDTSKYTITVNPVPVVNTTTDKGVCNGSAVSAAFTGGANGTVYKWTNNNTNIGLAASGTGNISSFNATNTSNSIITASIIVTPEYTNGGTTCFGKADTFDIKVYPSATASITEVKGCGSTSLTASGGASYVWNTGATNASITVTSAGSYTVTATDANGCSATQSITTTINTAVTASISEVKSCGSTSLTASGGTSYSWSTGAITAAITVSSNTTYTVTVSGANSCSAVKSITTTINAIPTATITRVNSCGSTTLTAGGGTSFTWSTAATSASITVTGGGPYSVSVTDANGCTASKNTSATVNPVATLSTSQTNNVCNGASTGSATVTATGGTAPYTYSWSPSGGTAATASNLSAGTYTVSVSDANGCGKTTSVTITQPNALVLTTSQTNVTCNGTSTGNATVSVSGGTGSYTYLWSNAASTATASNLSSGTYTVTVKDANNCPATANVTVTQPNALTLSSSQTNVACNGGTNGSATVSVSGGTGSYSYLWSNGAATATTATTNNLAAGTYTVSVSDANSCNKTASFTINQPNALTASISSQTNVSCNGGATGSATVTSGGGTGTATYLWSNGATSATVSGLTAATYTVTATDANGCTKGTSVTITQPGVLTANISSQTNIACNGGTNGSATVTSGGGTGAATYLWSTNATTATITGLAAATYTVTATDLNGCTKATSVTISQPNALALTATQSNVSCNGGANGSATVTTAGGTGAVTYLWSNNATTATITGLAAGTYTVTVTDDNGCTKATSITISQPNALTAGISSQTNVSCNGGANGSATVSSGGGSGSVTYLWSNNVTTATITGLTAGTYTVTATDLNGCTKGASVTISQPNALTASISSQTNVSCNGGATGSATVTAGGGTGTATYLWSNGATSATVSGLTAATYTVTATDVNGCTKGASVTITQPNAITASISSQTNVACNGGATGSATVTAAGGTGTLTYLWSNGAATATINNLTAATYTVTVSDNNGCNKTTGTTITQPSALTASISSQTNVSCNGGSNGSVTVSTTGGTGAATYLWSTGATAASITGLQSGNYTVTVTDDNGCNKTTGTTITQPNALTATISSQTNVACYGSNTGSATVTAGGGTGTPTYLWSNGASTATITGVQSGNYTVTVTDDNGCNKTTGTTITQPNALTATISSQTNVACYGSSTGSATVTAGGGTGTLTYLWSNGSSTATITGLQSGNYTVTLTDDNGCNKTAATTITQPNALTATISAQTNVSCNGGSTGSAMVTAGGGTGAATYLWSNGTTTATASNLSSGTYSVTVTDDNACEKTAVVSITQPQAIDIVTQPVAVSVAAGANASFSIKTVSATSYQWQYDAGSGYTNVLNGSVTSNSGTDTLTITGVTGNMNGYIYRCIISNQVCGISKTSNGVTLTVTKAVPVITFTALAGKTYGDADFAPGATGTNTNTPITYASSDTSVAKIVSGKIHIIAKGSTTITASQVADAYYTAAASVDQQLNVSAAALTITADDKSIVRGAAIPALTVSYSGFVNNDDITNLTTQPTISVAATSNSLPGTYPITASGAVASNYTFTYLPGTLTISSSSVASLSNLILNKGSLSPAFNSDSTSYTASVCNTDSIHVTPVTSNANATVTVNGSTVAAGASQTVALVPGSNTITTVVTADDGSTTKTYTLLVTTSGKPLITSQTDVTCNGDSTGSLTVNGNGIGAYSYLWSNGSTTATITGLKAGNYAVTVTDSKGCSATTGTTVSQSAPITIGISSQTNVACNGGNNGAVTVSAGGGISSATYAWSNGATTANITGLTAGTYTITVTGGNGCTKTDSVKITEPNVLTATISTQTNLVCNGSSTGSATVSSVGGTGTATYLWSNGTTTATATGLSAGTYYVTVTDANGCTKTASATLTEPNALTATITESKNCGSTDLTATGATNFRWDNGATTATINVTNSGAYTVTITNTDGCTATTTKTVSVVPEPVITFSGPSSICKGGFAIIGASSSVNNSQFVWSTGSTAGQVTINPAITTTYTVTVTSPANCTATAAQQIIVNDVPAVVIGSTVGCGSTLLNVSGGGTYLWDDSTTTAQRTITANGIYTVTVTNTAMCTATSSISAVVNPVATASVTSLSQNCGNTVIQASGNGSFTWDDGSTNTTRTVYTSGTYTVTVTTSTGCTASTGFAANVKTTVPGDTTAIACESYTWNGITHTSSGNFTKTITSTSGCDSVITLHLTIKHPSTGDTSAVACNTYTWNGITYTTSGNFTKTLVNAAGCDSVVTLHLTINKSVVRQQNITLCSGESITVGTHVYKTSGFYTDVFTAYSGCDSTVETSLIIRPVATKTNTFKICAGGSIIVGTHTYSATGTYTDIFKTVFGCDSTVTTNLTVGKPIILSTTVTGAGCNGSNDGTATAIATGGAGQFVYRWDDGTFGNTITNQPAGTYTVTVTDINNCTASADAVIQQASTVIITASVSNVKCNGDNSGGITLTITGGTPAYRYNWNTSSTSAALTDLVKGTYAVTVTDAGNCTATGSYVVSEPSVLTIGVKEQVKFNNFNVSQYDGDDGVAEAFVSGGTAPYQYHWSDGKNTRASATGLRAGLQSVTVTDANGCEAIASVTLNQPAKLEMPGGMSPNGDGLNDYFVIHGIEAYPSNHFEVYDRNFIKVYEATDYKNQWNGENNVNPQELPIGTYFVIFTVTDFDITLKGYVELRR